MHEVKYTIQYCTYSQLQQWKWLTFNKFFSILPGHIYTKHSSFQYIDGRYGLYLYVLIPMYIDYVSLLVNSNKTNISFRSTFSYSASSRVCRYLLVFVSTRLRSLWTITVIDVRTNHTSSKLITNTIVFADTVELLIDRVFDCIKRFYLKSYIV